MDSITRRKILKRIALICIPTVMAASGLFIACKQTAVVNEPGQSEVTKMNNSQQNQASEDGQLDKKDEPQGLAITEVSAPSSVEKWDLYEISFDVRSSKAEYKDFPYEEKPAAGLEWLNSKGITVEAFFTNDNWATTYHRDGFWYQPYDRELKSGLEWMYPSGTPMWKVRFAAPAEGGWKYKLKVTEAQGSYESGEYEFIVTPPSEGNRGPIRPSQTDSRYYEYADGKTFLGNGVNLQDFTDMPNKYSYYFQDKFDQMGVGNEELIRIWSYSSFWGSAWQPWGTTGLDYEGYVPPTGLTTEERYGNGICSLKMDAANERVWYGREGGYVGIIPGRSYVLQVRWKTADIEDGIYVSVGGRPVVALEKGSQDWHISSGSFTASGPFVKYKDFLAPVELHFFGEKGAAYIDEIDLYEDLGNGKLGPQLFRNPKMNSYLTFDPKRGAAFEAVLEDAMDHNIFIQMVEIEKDEWTINHIGNNYTPAPIGRQYMNLKNTPVWDCTKKIIAYYHRWLMARFGAYRSLGIFEQHNEDDPELTRSHSHWEVANLLATMSQEDGCRPNFVNSVWSWENYKTWTDPITAPLSNTEFHVYANYTGWYDKDTNDQISRDTARFFYTYDDEIHENNYSKPTIWGEWGIDGDEQTTAQHADADGVWLHKFIWARCNKGGAYPLSWYTDDIFGKGLHHIFGDWNRFMDDIPLSNGRYSDVEASVDNSSIMVFGQKDVTGQRAHMWINNKNHTYINQDVSGENASITFSMGPSNASRDFTLEWWDTYSGKAVSTETVRSDEAGDIQLSISDLADDTAVKLYPVQ